MTDFKAYDSLPCSAVVFHTNGKFDIVYANPIYKDTFGDGNFDIHHEDVESFRRITESADTPMCVSFRCSKADGKTADIVMYVVKNSEDTAIGLLIDNTANTGEIEKSLIDPVSKVYNRTAAVKMIKERLAAMKPYKKCALLVMDIDNFKNINDTFGHLYGDAVIAMSAGSIKSILDDGDIMGRFGGDEFFVFTENTEEKELNKNLENIRLAMLKMRLDNNDENDISCSIGVALGKGGDDYDALFRQADSALYKAKKNGKNRFEYFDGEYIDKGAICYAGDGSEIIEEAESNEAHDITTIALEIASKSKSSENAVTNLMRHIGVAVNLDCIQIMRFDTIEDKVYLDYQWWREHGGVYNVIFSEKKSGYYQHNDLMLFRERFSKEKIFQYTPDFKEGFSKKYRDVFESSENINIMYSSNTEKEDVFHVVCYQCWEKDRVWKNEEINDMFEITKIISMFMKSMGVKSEREAHLEDQLDHSRFGLYSVTKFYEESGRINREAHARGEKIAVVNFDFNYFYKFNRIYGTEVGDRVMDAFGELLRSADKDRAISCYLSGSDKYIMKFRYNGSVDVCSIIEKELQKFCDSMGDFKEFPLVIKAGVCFYEVNQNTAQAMDIAKDIKRGLNPEKCICVSTDYYEIKK